MAIAKPTRRMTLHELLVHVEKQAHDLKEFVRVSLAPALADSENLSRPVRKHSQYPTQAVLHNSLDHLGVTFEELNRMIGNYVEWLTEIDSHILRERAQN